MEADCCLHFSLLTVTASQCCGYLAMCTEKWKNELNGINHFSLYNYYVINNTPEQQNSNGTFIFMKAACNFIVPSRISNLYLQPDYNIATLITVFLGAWFANEMRNDDSIKSCLLYNNPVLHALISIWLSLLLYANGLETKLQIWQQLITT